MRDLVVALVLAALVFAVVRVNRPGSGQEEQLVDCRAKLELLRLGLEVVDRGAMLAGQLADMAHSHGQICRRAYLACGVEEADERSQGEADQAAGVRRDDRGLQEGG